MATHEVAKQVGFAIRNTTIRARDLPEHRDKCMVTTSDIREMIFTLRERLVIIPVELVDAL